MAQGSPRFLCATLLGIYLGEVRCYDTRITSFEVGAKDLFGSTERVVLHQDDAEDRRTPFAVRIDVAKPFRGGNRFGNKSVVKCRDDCRIKFVRIIPRVFEGAGKGA